MTNQQTVTRPAAPRRAIDAPAYGVLRDLRAVDAFTIRGDRAQRTGSGSAHLPRRRYSCLQ